MERLGEVLPGRTFSLCWMRPVDGATVRNDVFGRDLVTELGDCCLSETQYRAAPDILCVRFHEEDMRPCGGVRVERQWNDCLDSKGEDRLRLCAGGRKSRAGRMEVLTESRLCSVAI